jgi:hypothetical protein
MKGDEDRLAGLFRPLLIALSALLYLVHFDLFHNVAYIEIYGLGDVAFLPIEVLLFVLVVDRVISRQEKRSQLTKLNVVIGVYFSEVGISLVKAFSDFDAQVGRIRDERLVKGTWTSRNFADASLRTRKHEYNLFFEKGDPKALHFLENLRIVFSSHSGRFCSVALKIRTSSNRKPSPNSFGRSSTSLMSCSAGPTSRTCLAVITGTLLVTWDERTAR